MESKTEINGLSSTELILYRLNEMKKSQERMELKLDGFPRITDLTRLETDTKKTTDDHLARIVKLEAFIDGLTAKIAGIAIGVIVLMVLAQYGLDKLVKL